MGIEDSDQFDNDSAESSNERLVRAITSLRATIKVDRDVQKNQRAEDLVRGKEEREEVRQSISELHGRIDKIPEEINKAIEKSNAGIYRDIGRIENNCREKICSTTKKPQASDSQKPSIGQVILKNQMAVLFLSIGFLLICGMVYHSATGKDPEKLTKVIQEQSDGEK